MMLAYRLYAAESSRLAPRQSITRQTRKLALSGLSELVIMWKIQYQVSHSLEE